jgi:hypothetical protein
MTPAQAPAALMTVVPAIVSPSMLMEMSFALLRSPRTLQA